MYASQYLLLPPGLAGRSFRTSLQEVALQAGRLFKAVHRYRDDFHGKKRMLSPLRKPAYCSDSGTCEVRRDHWNPTQCKTHPRGFHPFISAAVLHIPLH